MKVPSTNTSKRDSSNPGKSCLTKQIAHMMDSGSPAKRPRAFAFLASPSSFIPATSPSSFSGGLMPLNLKPLLSSQKRRPRHHTMPQPIASTTSSFEDEDPPEDKEDDNSEMNVYKKNGGRRQYNGDGLPFDVSIVSPPPEYLGRFQLDPRTHNGDIVEYDGRQFIVKRVRMRYKYSQGRYQMIGKAIQVKSLARKSIESFLERTLRDS